MSEILHRLAVGDKVLVRTNFGNGPVVEGVVINVDYVQDLFDYKSARGTFWAYPHQLVGPVDTAAGSV